MAIRTNKNPADSEAIKRRQDPRTGREYFVISLPLPEGGFIASIVSDQSFSATAPNRSDAEQAAESKFLTKKKYAAISDVSAMHMFSHPELLEPWPEEEEQGVGVDVFFPKRKGTPWRDVKRENGLE